MVMQCRSGESATLSRREGFALMSGPGFVRFPRPFLCSHFDHGGLLLDKFWRIADITHALWTPDGRLLPEEAVQAGLVPARSLFR
jgi:hypothetical protein